MTTEEENAIDWSLCTFEGNQIRQDQEFLAFSLTKKLEIVDDLGRYADEWAEKARLRRLSEQGSSGPGFQEASSEARQ